MLQNTRTIHNKIVLFVLGVLVLTILLVPVTIFAEEEGNQFTLDDIQTLADVLAIAIVTDTSMQLSEVQMQEALAALRGIEAVLKPQISASGEYRLENGANKSPLLAPPAHKDVVRTASGNVTLFQQLGPNAKLRAGMEKAALGLELSGIQSGQSLAQLALNVQDSYYGLIKAYYGLNVAEMAVRNAERNVEVAEHKESVGSATALDVLQEKQAVLEGENRRNAAELGLNVTALGILQTMGLDHKSLTEAKPWVQQIVAQTEVKPVRWEVDFDLAVQYALEHRSEIVALAKQRQMAEIDYATHLGEDDWTANLSGRYVVDDVILQGSLDSQRALMGTVATSDAKNLSTGVAIGGLGGLDVNPWQVGLSVTYTFSDGGSGKVEEDRLLLAIEKINLQYEAAKNGIYLEVYAQHEQLKQAWFGYELAIEGLKQAEQTQENLRRMLALGSIAEKDVLDAELFVAQANSQVISAGLDYQAQKAKLAKALGVDAMSLIAAVGGTTSWDTIVED